MRISDWSSDVCSSDLEHGHLCVGEPHRVAVERQVQSQVAGLVGEGTLRERRRVVVVPVRAGAALGAGAAGGLDAPFSVGPIDGRLQRLRRAGSIALRSGACGAERERSEEHTSELQSLMRISYAVFCLKKKTPHTSI